VRLALSCLTIALLLVSPRETAADARDDRHALVMLRVLAYDKQLAQRIGNEVRLVVVAIDDAEEARWKAAFAKAAKLKLEGRPVRIVAHRFESTKALEKLVGDQQTAAILLADGVTKKMSVAAVARLTRAKKVLSIATRESDVADGVAVAVINGSSRDEIVINPQAVEAEGVKFDAGLLQLARKVSQ
jgi:hypothetical protein